MIAIIDYGMANLRSVQKAFEQVGHRAEIISTPEEIDGADKIVLPGVGAFKDAVATLRRKSSPTPIVRHIEKGKPFLGICLGLQMLFDDGYEDGEHDGLGVFRGKCVRFDVDDTMGLKVPHMGWNQLQVEAPLAALERPAGRNRTSTSSTATTSCPTTSASSRRRRITAGRSSAASGATT